MFCGFVRFICFFLRFPCGFRCGVRQLLCFFRHFLCGFLERIIPGREFTFNLGDRAEPYRGIDLGQIVKESELELHVTVVGTGVLGVDVEDGTHLGQRHADGIFVSRESLISLRNREPQAQIRLPADVHVAILIIDADGGFKGDQEIGLDAALGVKLLELAVLDHDPRIGRCAEAHARRGERNVYGSCSRKLDPLRVPYGDRRRHSRDEDVDVLDDDGPVGYGFPHIELRFVEGVVAV